MRCSISKTSVLLLLLSTSATVLLAQTNDRFAGKWELNVSKSKFKPPPALKNETVTNENGKTTIEGITGEGQPYKWSFNHSPGVAVPVEGRENSTVVEKISGNTIDHSWKMGAGKSHGHGVLSKDGKTLKYVNDGTTFEGQAMHDVYVFEKQ
jgi:hypothetical protein